MCNFHNLGPYNSHPLQETLNQMLESMNLLKRAICTMTLPMINTTSPTPLCYAVLTFCKSNNTVFEVSLRTLNQVCVCLFVCIHFLDLCLLVLTCCY